MTRCTIFCLLVCLLLAAAELVAADLVYSSSPKFAPLCLGLILLATELQPPGMSDELPGPRPRFAAFRR
jgi:hypothetical protein